MIIEVKETVYKGILVEHVKDQGWKCNLGGQEYLFPNYVAAQSAIDEVFADLKPIITKRKGTKIRGTDEVHESNPQCENCERIARLFAKLNKHKEADKQLDDAIMNVLNMQKEAFQSKDYQEAEKLLDALIEGLKE